MQLVNSCFVALPWLNVLHVAVFICINLSTQGSQILSGLSLDEYKTTLKMIEKAILATDLALYMK